MYEIFEQLLKKRKITPYRVSKETGVPQSTLSDWKRGRSVPKTEKLQKIANYLGVTLDYLLGNEQKKNPHITCRSEMSMIILLFLTMKRATSQLICNKLTTLFCDKVTGKSTSSRVCVSGPCEEITRRSILSFDSKRQYTRQYRG